MSPRTANYDIDVTLDPSTRTLTGSELNLVHFVALLLVFSMGVDYGIFMAETRSHAGSRAATG